MRRRMNRRETVKARAAGVGFWLTPVEVRRAAEFAARARSGGRGYEPKFFTPHEWETTRLLVDLVIPRDGRSGSATDAGVPEFMDFVLTDEPGRQTAMRGGLAWLDHECDDRYGKTFVACTDAEVLGVWSPNAKHADEAAALARRLDVGGAKAFPSIAQLVADRAIDAVWLCGPNFARVENVEEIADTIARGKGELKGIACEKPLARNVAEAKRVAALVTEAGIAHGYLENQAFAPAVTQGRAITWARGASLTGRPYLARAAEEHSGPHTPWFWRGELQGGGVLNDMMCHSALVVRHLLTKPGAPASSVRPARVTGHIASLKWTRPEYAKRLQEMLGKDVHC